MVEIAGKSITKKNYNKIGTEDDPVIIAQRFLNIFRQLHIFSAERKDAFNRMILEQTAEIRGMFSSLPGGAVLQQYVDDLEEQNGVTRSISDINITGEASDDAKAKILATALAEANNQAQPNQRIDTLEEARLAEKIAADAAAKAAVEAQTRLAVQAAQEAQKAAAQAQAQMAAQAEALAQAQAQLQAQAQANLRTAPEATAPQVQTVLQPASTTLKADASFTQEIASALKEAIIVTDDNRKKDSEEITKAIVDSQSKLAEIMIQNNSVTLEAQNRLAQMLVQNNTASNASSSNNNANNIQINTAATFPPVEEMLNGIVKVQSELFKEMAKTQTRELSSIISLALKESQQLSTQSIITAIKEMQKENLKFLQMHPISQPQGSPSFQKPEGTKYAVPEPVSEAEPIRPFAKEVVLSSEEELTPLQTNDVRREIFGEESLDEAENPYLPVVEGEETSLPKKKKKKKKKKKNNDGLSLDGLASSLLNKVSTLTDKVSNLSGKKIVDNSQTWKDNGPEAEQKLWSKEAELELPETKITNNGLDISLFDTDTLFDESSVSEVDPEQTSKEDAASMPAKTSYVFDKGEPETEQAVVTSDSEAWEYVEVPTEENLTLAEPEAVEAEQTSDSEAWEYVEVPTEENLTLAEPEAVEAEETSDSEAWEYVEVPTEENLTLAEPEAVEAEQTSDSEAWEYVEDSVEEAPQLLDGENSGEENEWEWEYEEEVDTPVTDNLLQAAASSEVSQPMMSATTPADGEEDWEWDYEEVSEDEITTTETTEEDGWEYVEVPEEDESTDDEGWEYVEVPEDETDAASEWEYVEDSAEEVSQLLDGENSGEEDDWEWEYEEISEEGAELASGVSDSTEANIQANETVSFSPPETSGASDPYRPESASSPVIDSENTSLSSMYGAEVYFQDKVYQTPIDKDSEEPFKLPAELTDGLGLPDLESVDDKNEPYKPQGTI